MDRISSVIGSNIHDLRKQKGLTLKQLAKRINKGLSTLGKYESGQITMDVETLYEIAKALDVHIEQLLGFLDHSVQAPRQWPARIPAFFSQIDHVFCYSYDGRKKALLRARYDILRQAGNARDQVYGYVNFADYEHYRNCETGYHGHVVYDEAVTSFVLENPDSPMDNCLLQISAPFIDSDIKWALCTAVSIHPIMPIAFKMLISKKPLPENQDLFNLLYVSRNDISQLKQYNMLSVHYDEPFKESPQNAGPQKTIEINKKTPKR